jgi:pyridoxal phosphate enzyme (YggS family)
MDICARVAHVRNRIAAAAERSGRSPEAVRLVVVSKYRTVEEIEEALRAGVTDIGENRVQEAEQKQSLLAGRNIVWHLVGHLQSNKAKRAVRFCDWIHSVDSTGLAHRLNRLAAELGKTQRVLLQVDLAGEKTKAGMTEAELVEALAETWKLPSLRIEGLMVLPPYFSDHEKVRPYFAKLREIRDELRKRELGDGALPELSMGMSHDFEVAIEEGATMVRVGTALFGERPLSPPSLVKDSSTIQEE